MKILIVEDDEKLAKMLKIAFQSEGFAVDYLTEGEAAERRIKVHYENYDLVILDLMLPGKSGMEVCQAIREKGISIPILVLTAKVSTEDKLTLFDLGADDYVVKPFVFKELLARVRALGRRPKKSLPRELKVRDLTLNPATQKVFKGNREIKLTLTEFRLLEYLMKNPGQPIGRDQLLDNIWDFNFDSFSNVVDVHVKNLRKKIDGRKKGNLLETVRGVGYRIKEA